MKKTRSGAQTQSHDSKAKNAAGMMIARLLFKQKPKFKRLSALIIAVIQCFHRPAEERQTESLPEEDDEKAILPGKPDAITE